MSRLPSKTKYPSSHRSLNSKTPLLQRSSETNSLRESGIETASSQLSLAASSYTPIDEEMTELELKIYLFLFTRALNHKLGYTQENNPDDKAQKAGIDINLDCLNYLLEILYQNLEPQLEKGANLSYHKSSTARKALEYHETLNSRLKKKIAKDAEHKNPLTLLRILNTKTTSISTLIGTGEGIGITGAGAIAGSAAAGIGTAVTVGVLLFYLCWRTTSEYWKKKNAEKLFEHTDQIDNENIIELVSSLSAFYIVKEFEHKNMQKASLKLSLNPESLFEIFQNIYHNKSFRLPSQLPIQKELKAIAKQAKIDADKIHRHLIEYVNTNKAQSISINLYSLIIPSFAYNSEESPTVVKTVAALHAWLWALDKTLDMKDFLFRNSFEKRLEKVRAGVVKTMKTFKKELNNVLLETDDNSSGVSLLADEDKTDRVKEWVNKQKLPSPGALSPIKSASHLALFSSLREQKDKAVNSSGSRLSLRLRN
ncbi:CBU_1818 family Dot/Icm T4SS effector [Coxiella burnetii]|uniref:CBU_1818 family Dot/Icm T4SS effector n=1 Tax=Coxiella burnetii TaxID=777 RepID=UPI0000ECFD7E|nr:CBU_1818 family Dot/Icm T4SS effector [Coxiella burnetii]EAX33915.1 hypothetical protein A35_00565 [Coxiella burnetii 'MSU Goat Q177']